MKDMLPRYYPLSPKVLPYLGMLLFICFFSQTPAYGEGVKKVEEREARIGEQSSKLRLPYLDTTKKGQLQIRELPADLDEITVPKEFEDYPDQEKQLPPQLSIEAQQILLGPPKPNLKPHKKTPLDELVTRPDSNLLASLHDKVFKTERKTREQILIENSQRLQLEYEQSIQKPQIENNYDVPVFRTWLAHSMAHTVGRHTGRPAIPELDAPIHTTSIVVKDKDKLPQKRIERLKISQIKPTKINLQWKQDDLADQSKRPVTRKVKKSPKKKKVKKKTTKKPISSKQKKLELQKSIDESIKEVEDGEVK